MDGLAATRIIRQQKPSIRIIALTSYVSDELVQAALNAGVTSYLLKNVSIDVLAQAIHDAYNGKSTLAREATQALVDAAQRPQAPDFSLTPREWEVLRLMMDGMTNAEIAEHLVIGVSTVKKHVSRILNKLNTDSRTEAGCLRHAPQTGQPMTHKRSPHRLQRNT
jgi:NarL family two-component system response regulator LiaR